MSLQITGGVLPVKSGGTGSSTSTGSGSVVLQESPNITGKLSIGYNRLSNTELTISSWTYDQALSGITNPYEIFFKPDGTKLFVAQATTILQYTLNTPWDLGNVSAGASFTIPWDTSTYGIYFSPDGTKLVTCGLTAVAGILPGVAASENRAWYATVETPWDLASTVTLVSTLRFDTGDAGLPLAETAPTGIDFNTDGTKMYVLGSTNDKVYQYSLTTPYNVSTATYVTEFSIATDESTAHSLHFNSTGSTLYICGSGNDSIYEYRLNIEWDVSSAELYDKVYVGNKESQPTSLYVTGDEDGYIFIAGTATDSVYRYTSYVSGLAISAGTYNNWYGRLDLLGEVAVKFGGIVTDSYLLTRGPITTDSTLSVTSTIYCGGDITVGGNDVLIGSATTNATLFSGITTGALSIATSQTTGAITIGGTAATGTITLGRATTAQTINIGASATASATTKTINIGTLGVSGSTTAISIGSAVSGATSNIALNGTVTFNDAITETVYNVTGTSIDPANGTIQYKTLSANTTFTENFADGQSVTLMINPATFTVTWPTTTWVGSTASTAPTLVASVYNCITFFQFGGVFYGKYEGRV